MQMVKRIIGGFFLLILLLWLLSPKQELYYLLEKELKKSDVIIANETIQDTWYGVKILNADVYFKGTKMAEFSDFELNFFFLYNTLRVHNIDVNKAFHRDAPKHIESIDIEYSVIDPLRIKLNATGSFGVMEGKVMLDERKIEILLPVAKDIEPLRKFLKKDTTGEWQYETTY